MPDPNPTPTEVLREELRALRARTGITADLLAERTRKLGSELTQSKISAIERGQRGVSLDEAVWMAVALGFAPDRLFNPGSSGDPFPEMTALDEARRRLAVAEALVADLREELDLPGGSDRYLAARERLAEARYDHTAALEAAVTRYGDKIQNGWRPEA